MSARVRPSSSKADVPVTAYVALGSNLGPREEHLRAAVRRLDGHDRIAVTKESGVYESRALTLDPANDLPAYLNAVVELKTSLSAAELLSVCHRIEHAAGRRRREGDRWKSRTLDLDILLFGNETIEVPGLSVPHPRMTERRFVLRPLADVALDADLPPPIDTPVDELLKACPDENEPVRRAVNISGGK